MVRRKDLSPLELMDATFARIERLNPQLNALVSLDPERAGAEAAAQTKRLVHGEDLGPLGGIPFAVKDLENAAGLPSTFGSRCPNCGSGST